VAAPVSDPVQCLFRGVFGSHNRLVPGRFDALHSLLQGRLIIIASGDPRSG